ncbi:uncharacterized protein SETTUDRAFT_97696 [Exserohilum turcica Et28A]|uniref:C2H2-type domain-containing protein n=1 Tax=Exserohilum turcicum (strain 28A) TaxID=671987 RepID=R0I996_EXST2|nr:uncharacterized protein SETTUDRAFT_97696 [Exserohilum turcica Et28A]EOA82060.1 hypothetical protein SETTUDRAFT_97696 [Exserohilum turcica Et28A]
MSANGYNPYNYPYQQSSAQQRSAYSTAPASNVAQASRQYQPLTTQAQNYIPYQSQSYANQNSGYATAQGASWNHSHDGARETTSQAAEVLHNMSNTLYATTGTAATNQAGFTATHTTASHSNRFGTGSSRSPQVLAQQNHSAYGQSQARPHSVNNNRTQQMNRALPSPGIAPPHTMYNQQQQRTASPAQPQYNTAPVSDGRSATANTVANQQYGNYSGQQLPSVGDLQGTQSATPSGAYNYATEQLPPTTIAPHTPSVSIADTYHAQGTTTVDPMAVYDPWPEYQRKQAEKLAKEHAARAEEERVAEEQRKAEEQKKEEERKRQEEENSLRQPKSTVDKVQDQQQPTVASAASAAPASSAVPGEALESEIRAMMAKMRELNSKDPALLARIWEEERKTKASKPNTAQNKTAPQATTVQPAQPARASTPQSTNSQQHTGSREATNANTSKPADPAVAQAVPVRQAPTTATRPTGNTVWPHERKVHVANAAASYLNSQNSFLKIRPGRVLDLLNGNPSYIQLCEQLEQMNFKLDRAAFARSLLAAVPDVNSKARTSGPPPTPAPVQKPQVPPAVMKKEVSTPAASSPQHTPVSGPPTNGTPHSALLDSATPADHPAPAPVAEMVPIKPELRKPANKEEAARKRNLSDLVDLTQLSEDEDMGPPPKRLNTNSAHTSGPPHLNSEDAMEGEKKPPTPNFPMADISSHPPQSSIHPPAQPPRELGLSRYVEPLDRKKALRRNNYNPATIARDVLLACGRHPSQRNLNQHLDVLRTTLPLITFDADLSTIRWDRIDPGKPPQGYFKDRVEDLTQDADDEDESEDEEARPRPRSPSKAIGGEGGAHVTAQALPEAINPFKQKRRVGYSAFRSATQYGPDGQSLPKKKGRPVGWRKAIHGSAAIQARPAFKEYTGPLNKHQPTQSSTLRNVDTGQTDAAIRIGSRSPSAANRAPQYQSYKCKWLNCKADLHNLDTLKKHVFKVHRKESPENTLDCLWGDCGKEVTSHDPLTDISLERYQPHSFDLENNWRSHIQQTHLDPLSWELGDGPASGLSDSHDSEAYLSDAQGRQVTPRITVDPKRVEALTSSPPVLASASRGRGRPPKRTAEEEARDAHERLVALKKRIGGPGMDRGGATLVNDKRRRGLIEGDETEEEIVNMED